MSELHGYYLEDMKVGMTGSFARTITEADVVLFAGVTGDSNPVHLNQEYANKSLFGGRIAHGMLTASFISTVLGMKMPGPGAIYVSQKLNFRAPVRIGDTVEARATVIAVDLERGRVTVDTECKVGDTVVIDGQAELLVLRRVPLPKKAAAE